MREKENLIIASVRIYLEEQTTILVVSEMISVV